MLSARIGCSPACVCVCVRERERERERGGERGVEHGEDVRGVRRESHSAGRCKRCTRGGRRVLGERAILKNPICYQVS